MVGWLAQEGGPIHAVFGSFEDTALWVIFGISLVALLFAWYLVREVLSAPEGTDKMKEIAKAIQEGASAYLSRQFRTVAVFLVVLAVVIFFVLPVPAEATHSDASIRFGRSIAFILGAFFSAITGYIGMWLAVRANVRTANAARESGLQQAMRIAFRAGGVAGMFTVGLGLLGAVAILIIYKADAASVLVGFGFGGALLAMFMRVGGGIFTKAADVGADLVGKVEQGIPEDDPRNAATIADNVGDNVGDCAGMAADLFESSEVTLIASLILGAAAYAGSPQGAIIGVMFPLFVRAIGVVTSIIGILAVTPRSENEHGMKAINRGFFAIGDRVRDRGADPVGAVHGQLQAGASPSSSGSCWRRVIQVLTAVLHRHEVPPRAGDRRGDRDRAGHDDPVRVLDRSGVDRVVGADRGRRDDQLLLPRRQRPPAGAVLHLADRHGHADDGRRDRVDGHVRPDLRQRAGHRRDVGRVRGPAGRDPHRPRRDRQLHEGHHEGHRDRDRRDRRDLAVRLVRGGAASRRVRLPGHPRRPAERAGRAAAGRLRWRSCSARWRSAPSGAPRAGRGRGPQAVPRPPRDHGLHREARLRRRRRHLHADLAAGADDAGPAGRARADDRRPSSWRPRRSARSSPARSSPASCWR